MNSKLATTCLVVMISSFMSSYANGGLTHHVESTADKLYSNPFAMPKQLDLTHETTTQYCHMNDTAVLTIYSTNSEAQAAIDLILDGSHVGSLTTYFPSNGPDCKTRSAEGVITLIVPAGKHTLEANSLNLTWPSHNFSVDQCQCMVLPLP